MDVLAVFAVTLILFGLTIFQVMLILGYPLGEFAWGGQHKILPVNLKISSSISVVLYFIIAFILLNKVGVLQVITQTNFLKNFSLAVAIYFTTGIPLNLISRSKKERLVMTPLVTILAGLSWIVALY